MGPKFQNLPKKGVLQEGLETFTSYWTRLAVSKVLSAHKNINTTPQPASFDGMLLCLRIDGDV